MKNVVKYILWAWSAWMLINGFIYYVQSMGVVYGTEFSMLITLVSIAGTFMIWLAIFTLWRTLDDKTTTKE